MKKKDKENKAFCLFCIISVNLFSVFKPISSFYFSDNF